MIYESIGAFSRRTGLSVRALRLYDELGVLRPASVDPRSGYRFYEESQAITAELVRLLRSVGMPLDGVLQALDAIAGGDPAEVHAQIDRHWSDLEVRHSRGRTLVAALHLFLDQEDTTVPMTIPSRTLAAALEQVMPAASHDGERPVLMSILFEGGEEGLRLVATDSYRMAVANLPGIGVLDDGRKVLIPASLLREVAAGLPADDDVTVEFGEGAVTFEVGGQQIVGETVEGSFPDYRKVLTATEGHKLSADRSALIKAIELARTDVPEPSALVLDLGGTIVVRALGDDGTAGSDRVVDGRWAGPAMVVGVNAQFLVDGIGSLSSETVDLFVTDSRRPIWVRSPNATDFAYLLMPVPLPAVVA